MTPFFKYKFSVTILLHLIDALFKEYITNINLTYKEQTLLDRDIIVHINIHSKTTSMGNRKNNKGQSYMLSDDVLVRC